MVRYSRYIRLSPALIAVATIFQLVISFIMDHPYASKPMTSGGGLYFRWHEWVDVVALAILACGWIYRVINWKQAFHGRFFPWVTAPGRLSLVRETGQFLRFRWTEIPQDGALVGTIHGLGLSIIAALVLTGGALYVALGAQNTVTPQARSLVTLHLSLATFMWIYLCGHTLMAVWHQYIGQGDFARTVKL